MTFGASKEYQRPRVEIRPCDRSGLMEGEESGREELFDSTELNGRQMHLALR